MTKINVAIEFHVGGAWVFTQRLAKALPQYEWVFSKAPVESDIVLYMNDHRHYINAKKIGVRHIIQRKTGRRSLATEEPPDLDAVVCASLESYNKSKHKNKVLIYNGVDLEQAKKIKPIKCDLLCSESRCGKGQKIDRIIDYALKNKRHLTLLGNGDGIANDDTYKNIKRKYPQFDYPGRVSPEKSLGYIKGCKSLAIANPSHGCSNSIIEGLVFGREIIDLTPKKSLEIPPIDQLYLKLTAKKYDELFKDILK